MPQCAAALMSECAQKAFQPPDRVHALWHYCTGQVLLAVQEELIGQEKDKAGDEGRRAKLHQQWLEKQDEQELAKLMDGVRNGFRRKRAGDLLLDDVRSPAPFLSCFAMQMLLLSVKSV